MRMQLLEVKAEMIRNGVRTIDLLEANIVINFLRPEMQPARVFLVEERHLARPDLISFDALGSPDYVDLILKYNQITNPFSMELNDIIMVPPLTTLDVFYQKSAAPEATVADTKSLFIHPERASQKDVARIRQLEKIASRSKNGATEVKPTNLLRGSEAPFIANGDSLLLSPGNSKSAE